MDSHLKKSTHEQIELWQPVIKNSEGKYIAVLSDDSIDRDEEIVGKSALMKIMANDGYTAMLLNHKNDVLGQIGEWTNKRIEEIDGHTAFIAEPKFYLSNPNAKIIKGCLDEGAKYGISIGAIPKAWEDTERNGKSYRTYTDLELLEASWVAIPSNRHGRGFKVAKMFSNIMRDIKMEDVNKIFSQEDIDKAVSESTEKLSKAIKESEDLKVELGKMKVDHETIVSDMSKKLEESEKEKTEMLDKSSNLEKELEELKTMSVLKGDMTTTETDDRIQANKEIEKAISEGKMPVIRR